jgi:hypothetical protein
VGDAGKISVLRRPDLKGVELWRIRASRRLWACRYGMYAFWVSAGSRVEWQCRRRRLLAAPGAVGLLGPDDPWLVTAVNGAADHDLLLVEPRAVEAALGGTGSFHRGRTLIRS